MEYSTSKILSGGIVKKPIKHKNDGKLLLIKKGALRWQHLSILKIDIDPLNDKNYYPIPHDWLYSLG